MRGRLQVCERERPVAPANTGEDALGGDCPKSAGIAAGGRVVAKHPDVAMGVNMADALDEDAGIVFGVAEEEDLAGTGVGTSG